MTDSRVAATILGLVAALAVPAGLAAQSYQTMTQARRLESSSPLTVHVEYAVGRFRFTAGEAKQLYRVALTYDENLFEPKVAYQADQHVLTVDLSGRGQVNDGNIDEGRQRLDLSVSPDVPLDLSLTFGAVRADIELGGLSLRGGLIKTGASETTVSFDTPNKLTCGALAFEVGAAQFEVERLGNSRCSTVSLKGGVGEIVLDLSGEWPAGADNHVTVSVGLGEVRFRIPKGLGVRLDVDRFLATVDQAGFVKRGAAYFSPDYDAAPVKVALDVNAVLGSIALDWIR